VRQSDVFSRLPEVTPDDFGTWLLGFLDGAGHKLGVQQIRALRDRASEVLGDVPNTKAPEVVSDKLAEIRARKPAGKPAATAAPTAPPPPPEDFPGMPKLTRLK
jgi:hypothetical protein